MQQHTFRDYQHSDYDACLAIFNANCPEFLAPNERADYEKFLKDLPHNYAVCVIDNQIVGAFGFVTEASTDTSDQGVIEWILLHPDAQGRGVGASMMERIIASGQEQSLQRIRIATSHKSAAFFAKFGAKKQGFTENGWGPGMHRVDMILVP